MAKIQPAAAGDTTTPADEPVPAETAPEAAEQDEAPTHSFWRYIGQLARTYMHIPVTVEHGDVITHPGPPAEDGHWEPHDGPATREPDNAPQPAPLDGADTTTVEE